MRERPINNPDITFQRTLTPLPKENSINRFPTYYSILLDKRADAVYNYHNIFSRTLYTRINLRFISNVFPQTPI